MELILLISCIMKLLFKRTADTNAQMSPAPARAGRALEQVVYFTSLRAEGSNLKVTD